MAAFGEEKEAGAGAVISSLRYLKRASARMRRRARVEDIALLLARCLLVALLALALARPVISSRKSIFGLEWPRAVVVVVDATASMNWHGASGTRLSQAKRQAADWIGNLSTNDKVALWVLTDHLEKTVPEPVSDHRMVLRALAEVKEGSDLPRSLPCLRRRGNGRRAKRAAAWNGGVYG